MIVHPDAEGAGERDRAAALGRGARRRARHRGPAPVRVRRQRRRARASARRRLRRPPSTTFVCALTSTTSRAAPDAPLRTFDAARDEAAVHALIQDAFAEIEGSRGPAARDAGARSRSTRRATTRRCGCCSRTRRASAGAALGERWEDGAGYVAELGRRARGRAGAATAARCCSALFEAFRRRRPHARRAERPRPQPRGRCASTSPSACARRGRPSAGRRHLDQPDVATIAARATRGGTPRARHGVHAGGPVPAAAVPRADRRRGRRLGARPARWASTRRRSPPCSPTRTIEIVVHAGRQDVAILRREWRTDVTNVFDTQVAAGFAGFSAQAGYNGLLHDVAADPAAEDRELHALGRAAADRRAAALRARRRRAPAAAGRRHPRAAGAARPARVGARGVPRDRRRHRRARPRGGLAAAAAGGEPGPARARGGARAGRLARAHRVTRGPAGRRGRARPDGRRARQAPAGRAGASWPRSAA